MSKNAVTIGLNKAEFRKSLKVFDELGNRMDRKFITRTLRRNAKPMEAEMKRNAPTADNDTLVKNIGITTSKKKNLGRTGVRVGVVKDKSENLNGFSAPALASVIEYGTEERYRKLKKAGIITGRASTGSVEAKPFIRRAYDRHEEKLMEAVINDINKEFEKI